MVESSLQILEQIWQVSQTSQSTAFPWLVLISVCISMSFALVAIVYMLGRVFESDRLKKFAQAELLTAIATVIIVGLFITLMISISNIVSSLSMEITKSTDPALYIQLQREISEGKISPDTAHFYPAHNYVDSVKKCVSQMYVINLCSAMVTEPLAYMTSKTELLSIPVFAARNTARTLDNTFTFLLYTMYMQKHMLFFAQQVCLAVFLPLGILLRSTPLSRGAGNLFIALGLGLYFVYPLSYSIVMMISVPPSQFENKCGVAGSAGDINPYLGCAGAFGKSALFSSLSIIPVFNLKDLIGGLSPILKFIAGASAITTSSLLYYNQIQPLVNEAITYAMVYPLVVMAITLTFIRSFAIFLGADAQDMVQGLLRII